ncbi:Anaphase-promoting complex subunit [Dirofilaria immitis]
MHGCEGDNEQVINCSDMIVADLLEPVVSESEEHKIRYRSLSECGGEKLVILDDSVTIQEYPSGVVRRRLTADFTLLDAFWCEFPNTSANSGPLHGICLIGHKNLIFASDNDWISYTITLPFTVKRVFRSALGLILQRTAPLPSSIANFPHLFSLSHPYCEILPVISKSKDTDSSSHYVWDSTEVALLETLNDCQLLLTYSTTARVHSLYWVRRATKAEWKCAASKAESVVSCNTTFTPVGRTSQLSTPQMSSQPRNRFDRNDSFADEAWTTPQTRSVRTRSMTAAAALIQSLPFPTTSPAQRSSANRSITDSPILRLRGGSAHTTPRLNSFCDDSIISLIETRGSELDLLAPEICMECIWTERRQVDPDANSPASTAFLTQDFTGQIYVCFYVAKQNLLKCVRGKMHDEGRITTSSFTTIPCKGAADVKDYKMMAIIDLDGAVILYSGVTRIGALYGNYEFINFKEPSLKNQVARSITDSPILRLRGGSAHTTPRLNSFCDDSIISLIETRGSELDLLAPEICMECIWTERRQVDPDANSPASTAFLTQDFTGQIYVCFYVAKQNLLKCVRGKMHDEGRITTSSFTTIPCKGAADVKDYKMMAIIDLDGAVILYSGVTRIGALYGNYEFINFKEPSLKNQDVQECKSNCGLSLCTPVIELHTAFIGHIILETQRHELVMCKLPSITSSPFVAECLSQICSNLPLDKAMKLSSSWCTSNTSRLLHHYYDNRVAAEVAMFVQFVFAQCGLHIQDFSIFREINLLRSRCEEEVREKKKRTDHFKHIEAWQRIKHLCSSRWWNFDNTENLAPKCYSVSVDDESSLYHYSLAIFTGLHAIYESAKLDRRTISLLFILASSLHAFAQKDFPVLSNQSFKILEDGGKILQTFLMSSRFSPERIPSWHDNLLRFLDSKSHLTSITSSHFFAPIVITIAIGLKRLENIADIQKVLGKSHEKKLRLNKTDAEQFANILNENSSTVEKCEKLAQLFRLTKSSLLDLPPAVAVILCELLYEQSTKTLHFLTPAVRQKDRSHIPSAEEIFLITRWRWKHDLRCINVIQMLDSRRPIFIPSNNEALSEASQREMAERLLKSFSIRNITHAFGRSALYFRSFSPPLSRPRVIPPLNLQGRLHPTNAPVELPQNELVRPMIKWGSFYNAVAAGLCIGDSSSLRLDSEWLAMSINNLQGPEAAGLMYAFGLNGHITNMNLFMIHELLSSGDPVMSIAILLGCGVSRRATADVQMYKMMVTHLPFMMGPTLLELHIDTMIQTAALVALGLLFAQSSHMGILGQLINEIGRPACSDYEPPTDRYSYSLAAGFAIGLIALGRGEDLLSSVPFVEQYPAIASRLIVLMEGGLRSLCIFPSTTSEGACSNTSTFSQSNHVRESENVNPHLTASPATVALGLMYFRTGNRWAAESLKIPETISAIEEIRPDLILLRTLCRHLVLWNEITASKHWVEESVPLIILNYKQRLFDEQPKTDDDEEEENLRMLQAAVDKQTIAQTYLNVIAGACFAMAIRFASTWNSEAFNVIWYYVGMVLPSDVQRICSKLSLAAGATACLNVLSTLINSLGVLMAGSGNLQVLRLCRLLRTRVTLPEAYRDNTSHSLYAAANTVMGMLMLGRGRYALKTDDLSVAALVISFFPISPHALSDNRTYLQPLRLLWVIAAEERLLSSVDADSEEFVELEVEITFKASKIIYPDVLNLRTPCIIPELSLLNKVQVGGQEYEKQIFDLRHESDKQRLEEILKKHHGRMVVNYLGQKEQKIVVATIKQMCNGEDDPMLIQTCEGDLLKAAQNDQNFRQKFNFGLPEATNDMENVERPDISAFGSWIRSFQLDNGSIAAYDYAFSFVKDMLRKSPLHFACAQYNLLNAFLERNLLDQNDEWPIRSNFGDAFSSVELLSNQSLP